MQSRLKTEESVSDLYIRAVALFEELKKSNTRNNETDYFNIYRVFPIYFKEN